MSAEAKTVLRREVLRRRDALPEGERVSSSGRIVRAVLDLPAYQRSGVILAYASFGSELRTDEFLKIVLRDGKTLLLPRIESGAINLYEVRDPERDLAPGTWGIPEPVPENCPLVDPGAVDFVLIPGVAFDREGRRLGYGGGFYDRLIRESLSDVAIIVAGAFEAQVVEEVPVDATDALVDAVVTESGTCSPSNRADPR